MSNEEVLIKKSMFGDEASLIERYRPPQDLPPPKLNLKMRKSDIRIVDSIAAQAGTTRSQILNDLIRDVLLGMLNDLHAKDRHCANLLAKAADIKSGHDKGPLSGWSTHLFADQKNYDYYWDQELPSLEADEKLSRQYRQLFARLTTSEQ